MANSNGSEDKTLSSRGSENPFIAFRRVADAQISSLLQGIVGLPSALSKSETTKWSSFDERFEKRKELQYQTIGQRRTELEKSDDTDSTRGPEAMPANTTTTFPRAWSATRDRFSNSDIKSDNFGERDLPLYSSVDRSLFAHLEPSEITSSEWNALNLDQLLRPVSLEGEYVVSKSSIQALQQIFYHELNNKPGFRSSYSLLPYLLFSSYSPVNLSQDHSTGFSNHDIKMKTPLYDQHPYCEAFEDLILTTQGHSPLKARSYSPRFYPNDLVGSASAFKSFIWISKLSRLSLLQQRETILLGPLQSTSDNTEHPVPAFKSSEPEDSQHAQTEQDMYDLFLQRASSPPNFLGTIESLFTDTGLVKRFPGIPHMDKEKRNVKETAYGTIEVVSTRTTTEQITHEDGSVETSVMIQKKFSDGRESITTRTHVEDLAPDSDPPKSAADSADGTFSKSLSQCSKEDQKKGWFWG